MFFFVWANKVCNKITSVLFVVAVTLVGPAIAYDYTGLWRGIVVVGYVSEAESDDPNELKATPTSFGLPILVHVNADQQVNLLKEVALVWESTKPVDDQEETSGRYRVISDKTLVPRLVSKKIKSDSGFSSRRISTIAFDFEGDVLPAEGSVGPGQGFTAHLILNSRHPTNPYRHQFHPEHDDRTRDGLAGDGVPAHQQEVFNIVRKLEFFFFEDDSQLSGETEVLERNITESKRTLYGQYRETITGLHRRPIVTGGDFKLWRVVSTPKLN